MWYTIHIALCVWWGWYLTELLLYVAFPRVSLLVAHTLETLLLVFGMPLRFAITVGDVAPRLLLVALYYLLVNPTEWEWFRFHPLWKRVREHHLHVTFEGAPINDEQQQLLYAVSPHSMFAEHVTFGMVLNPVFRKVTVICTSLLFWIPVVRECVMWVGARPATSSAISHLLDQGRSIVLLPEGLRGALSPGLSVLRGIEGECEPRKGFLRCALTCKTRKTLKVVPVYAHGASSLYDIRGRTWFQKTMLSRFYYPWPLMALGWYNTFWPKSGNVVFRMGTPITLYDAQKDEMRDIDCVHEEFCSAMEGLAAWKLCEQVTVQDEHSQGNEKCPPTSK